MIRAVGRGESDMVRKNLQIYYSRILDHVSVPDDHSSNPAPLRHTRLIVLQPMALL